MCSSPKSSGRKRFTPPPKHGFLAGLSVKEQNSFTAIANAADSRRELKSILSKHRAKNSSKQALEFKQSTKLNNSSGHFDWLLKTNIIELFQFFRERTKYAAHNKEEATQT